MKKVNLGKLKDGEAFQRSVKGVVYRVVKREKLITVNSIHSNKTFRWPRSMKVYAFSGYVPPCN